MTDAGGSVGVTGITVLGSTATLTLSRPLGASPLVSYGCATTPGAAWLEDAAGAAVPVFDGVPVGP